MRRRNGCRPKKYCSFKFVIVGVNPADVAKDVDKIVAGLLQLTGQNSSDT